MNDWQPKTNGDNTETVSVLPANTAGKTRKTSGFITKKDADALSKSIAIDLKKARDIVKFDEFILKERDNLIELFSLGVSVDDIVLKLREGGFGGATKARIRSVLSLKNKKQPR